MTELDPNASVQAEQFAAHADETKDEVKVDHAGEKPAVPEPEEKEAPKVPGKKKREKVVASSSEDLTDLSQTFEEQPVDLPNVDGIDLPEVDYSGYSKNELAETLALIIDNRPPAEIRGDVDRIKSLFYKKLRAESDERKTKFLESGGKIEEYKVYVDPLDHRVKELLDKYKEKKTDYSKIQETEKFDNLKRKYDIIDKIKDLVNREESINKTFHEFRDLQNEWHAIGVVPQSSLKDLWENYHHNVEIFYDYIKINKELRDLDLKKNLELKIRLCEKAEELLLEPNPINAFRLLQDFHN